MISLPVGRWPRRATEKLGNSSGELEDELDVSDDELDLTEDELDAAEDVPKLNSPDEATR